ncbi:MAG: SPFH domain-containing protein [Bacteroidaceae bacterium]|nr:SPFH domain-containing protein [Bacteroidaceae bacterium]
MPIVRSIYWEQKSIEELIYKFPFNNLATGSVLTVNESQEALFFKSGVLITKFGPGRHVLSTSNFPILSKILDKAISGGDTTFLAEVWFVSKLEKRNILWGAGNLRVMDPYFQIPIKLSSRGQYGFRVDDGALFVNKVIGTIGFASSELIEEQFRVDVIESFKVTVSSYMKEQGININELASEYRGLSASVKKEIQNAFDAYGVEILNFNIEGIDIDEEDKNYQTVMEGVAEQAKLKKLGVNYVQKRQIDIAETAAGNEGAGNFMGMGMGLGVGQTMGGMVNNAIQQSNLTASAVPPTPQLPSYYVAKSGQTTGPYRIDVIQEMIVNREVTPITYVYKVGGTNWIFAKDDPEISQILSMLTPPPPPSMPPAPPSM